MTGSISTRVEHALMRASADAWNCLTHVLRERALQQAHQLEARVAAGLHLPDLAGIPFVAKSLFQVHGVPCLAGGANDPNLAPAADDARLVQQLANAGAVLIGVADMDEHAYGFLGQNPHRGAVINPRSPDMVSGGSSSGSAAAVAAGIVPFAIGSDTNGSVRVPAAFCGIYSLKPSLGALSLSGSQPLAPSLDHAGLLAASADLLQSVWQAVHPPHLRASATTPSMGFATGDFLLLSDAATCEQLLATQARWPHAPKLPFAEVGRALAAASVVTAFEAHRLHREGLQRTPGRYSGLIARRLAAGTGVSDAAYLHALRAQREIRATILAMMDDACIDVLIAPVAPVHHLRVAQAHVVLADTEVAASDAAGLFTRPFSLTGFPVLSTPPMQGADPKQHIPALQLVGRPGDEHLLFAAARCLAPASPARAGAPYAVCSAGPGRR